MLFIEARINLFTRFLITAVPTERPATTANLE